MESLLCHTVCQFHAADRDAVSVKRGDPEHVVVDLEKFAGHHLVVFVRRDRKEGGKGMNEYMKIAKELSEDNLKTKEGGPFGACIVKDGLIIGIGKNMVLKSNDPTAHAEVCAIRDACNNIGTYDLTGCELYTSCYPCPMCLSAIIWANIKKVYYGNTKEDAADIGFRDDFIYKIFDKLNNGIKTDADGLTLTQIDRDKCIETFKKYKEKDDKTIY